MPCIPDPREQREMQAEVGVRTWRNALEKLIPSYRRFLPVFEALLVEHPELAQSDGALQCLALMKQLAATGAGPEPARTVEALEAEATRLKSLAETAESGLCDAGTLAWRASKGRAVSSPQLQALLDRHQAHREADRRARLSQLRSEVRSIKKQLAKERARPEAPEFGEVSVRPRDRAEYEADTAGVRGALMELERRIADVKALSVDAICSDRFVF